MQYPERMIYLFVSQWITENIGLESPAHEAFEKARKAIEAIVQFDHERGGRITRTGDRDDRFPLAYALAYVITQLQGLGADPHLIFYYDYAGYRFYLQPGTIELTAAPLDQPRLS